MKENDRPGTDEEMHSDCQPRQSQRNIFTEEKKTTENFK